MEQRYQAVLAVIRDGVPIVKVARRFDMSALAVVAKDGSDWVSRVVAAHGMISVSNQPESVGKYRAGRRVDVHFQE